VKVAPHVRAFQPPKECLMLNPKTLMPSLSMLGVYAEVKMSAIWRLIAFATFMMIGAGAFAADVVIRFDDIEVGTRLSNQLLGRGVEFVVDPFFGSSDGTFPEVLAAPNAASPPRVASTLSAGGGEFRPNIVFAKFVKPTHQVKVMAGSLGPASESAQIQLFALDAAGNEIGSSTQTVTGGAPFKALEVSTAVDSISAVVLRGNRNTQLAIDDFTFDVPTVARPDFGVSRASPAPLVVAPGGTITVPLVLHRSGGSTGGVALTVSSSAPGVTGSVTPAVATGADGSPLTLTIAAAPEATGASGASVTVTASPATASAGTSGSHSLVIPFAVVSPFDARVNGIELSQGVQVYDLPQRGLEVSAPVPYKGVRLAQGGKTIVRVFGDLRVGPPEGKVDNVEAQLFGERDGAPLAGSPLKSETGPRTLKMGAGTVTDAVRADAKNAWTFKLPPDWTRGKITLRARIYPPAPLGASSREGEGPAYTDNNTFVLKDVPFTDTSYEIFVWPVRMVVSGMPLTESPYVSSFNGIFAEAVNLTPVAEGQLKVPATFLGDINITDIATSSDSATDKGHNATARLLDQADEWNALKFGSFVMGIYPSASGIRGNQLTDCPGDIWDRIVGCDSASVAVANETGRPITAVTHELYHMFGLKHAGEDCPDVEKAIPWPPDNKGFLQGVALDRRGGLWRAIASPDEAPYKVIVPPRTGVTNQWYDLMSYCGDERNTWISSLYADNMVNTFGAFADWAASMSTHSVRSTMIVRAVVLPGGAAQITKVASAMVRTVPTPADSPYRLTVRNAAGAVVNDVPMVAVTRSSEGGQPAVFLRGEVPPEAMTVAQRVEILHNGAVVARRERAATRPHITLVAPQAGTRISGESDLTVAWRATGERPLMSKVDYSPDGTNWWPVWFGPNSNHAVVRAENLAGSMSGRIRVRVSDGFDETVALSGPLQVRGSAPRVRITSPDTGDVQRSETVLEGTSLYLGGFALDDRKMPLTARQLQWSLDGQPIAMGEAASVDTLSVGEHTVTLTARDAQGRAGTATARVTVLPRSAAVK
jgi:hypothetical protein